MTIFHLEEENLDVDMVEVSVKADILVDRLDIDIIDLTSVEDITQDSLQFNLEEVTLETKIVEESLNIQLDEVLVITKTEGSGKIKKSFTFADFSGSELSIGNIPDGSDVQETIIEIETPFDGDLQLSVGTLTAQAILMSLDENLTDVGGRYAKTNNLEISGTENFRLFFVETIPSTIGSGRITIYYS